MELTNEFDVSVPVETAWQVLTDVERIAPCLPGAQLQEIEGDEYRGVVKVKVGPITAQYKGKAVFVERDDVAHRAVLEASGRDTRGQGNASATIVAQLEPVGTGTHVTVTTDLQVTGKVAQFGRGVLADVSAKILGQFVDNLEQTVLVDDLSTSAPTTSDSNEGSEAGPDEANDAGPAAGAASDPAASVESGPRRVDQPDAEPIDLLGEAGSPVLKRALPVVGVALAALVIWRLVRRRR